MTFKYAYFATKNKTIMRKVFLAILVIAAIAVMFGKFSTEEKLGNDLFLENVEALASGEGDNIWCVGSGNTYCPKTGDYVYYTKEPYNL